MHIYTESAQPWDNRDAALPQFEKMPPMQLGVRIIGIRDAPAEAGLVSCWQIYKKIQILMIKLYQYRPAFGLPNASPFCMKVETYLRMAGLPYECPRGADHFKSPKGKLPYIDDGGKIVADSTFIIDYLKAAYGDKLDARLSSAERALGVVIQRTFEESLYWPVVYSRWIDDAGFAKVDEAFFAHLKFPLRQIIPIFARRGLRGQLHGQGMGRHGHDEIYAIGCRDITALSEILGEKAYFLGNEPSSIDATGYAFLANLLWVPIDLPMRAHAAKLPNLEAYCQRMKARYYAG